MKKIDLKKLYSGEIRTLAKAITLVESSKESDQQEASKILSECLKKKTNTIRIGISGVPGVGKSTFIENFGLMLADSGKKVAVLAVDPSSSLTGGSILGDKTRMEELSKHPNAFIRPTPSLGHLGGVGAKTREAMIIVEAAGYDVILVETVGVGQSEFAVKNMVDYFTVLMLPGGGDEVQGIKKGIIEIADLLVINKADGESEKLAELTATQYETALSILKNPAKVLTCSALKKLRIEDVWKFIEESCSKLKSYGLFDKNRSNQNVHWMNEHIQFLLERALKNKESEFKKIKESVFLGNKSAMEAAEEIFSKL